MLEPNRHLARTAAIALTGLAIVAGPVTAAPEPFLLVDQDLSVRPIELLSAGAYGLEIRDAGGGPTTQVTLDECLALIRPDGYLAQDPESDPLSGDMFGTLVFADGERMPGVISGDAPPDADAVAWVHPRFGPMLVPLERVAAASLRPGAPIPESGQLDVVALANGDQLQGFIASVGDPVVIEVGDGVDAHPVEIPLARTRGFALVAPRMPPTGRRVWFSDGTVLDTRKLQVGNDGYLRFGLAWRPDEGGFAARLSTVSAVLFDSAGLVPLATLAPARVERTTPRYIVPGPKVDDPAAPLGLGAVSIRGPVRVRYALPDNCIRFAGEAQLPFGARRWGDYQLILRDDDAEVFRARLNRANPSVPINVTLRGSELTIELEQGASGPIQDHVVLRRAMLLVE
ncbi:MAG: hypothetical protein HKO59_04805 [Phycisphaerales bacterium]|nr:hypothetical protein [Phycisphaerae bacterium]NNF43723.1 hypothetical protein [Phycisphaerales bacterium]NNM25296.1 hypothetical protein [Phycisphaerales bacterium]